MYTNCALLIMSSFPQILFINKNTPFVFNLEGLVAHVCTHTMYDHNNVYTDLVMIL